MGGTVTNLAAVKHALAAYDPDVVRGTVLDLAEIDRQIERTARDADERRAIVGLQPIAPRSSSAVRASCALSSPSSEATSVTVTDRGVRHGVFADRFA